MNQKGLTLVELLATIVVLSAIALIVTPNVINSIKRSNNRVYDTQIENIKAAAKNWVTDKIAKDGCVAQTCSSDLKQDSGVVTLRQLQDGGYISEELENPKSGTKFNPDNVTVIIGYNGKDYSYSVEGV